MLAVIVPLAVTTASWPIASLIPPASLSPLYVAGVLIVAISTSTRAALLSALVSFLTYNFFFTEPRFTLFMLHRQDAITASVLILVATVTGHIAARLREQVDELETAKVWSTAQLSLAETLSRCLDETSVIQALRAYLTRLLGSGALSLETRIEPQAHASQIEVEPAPSFTLTGDKQRLEVNWIDPIEGWQSVLFDFTAVPARQTQVRAAIELTGMAWDRVQLARRLQQEIVNKEREQLRAALLSSVSHDLRTPLATMIGSVSSLIDLQDKLPAEQQAELLANTLSEAQRLDRYIQNLLDMTKMGSGELTLDCDWAGMDEIVSSAIKRLAPLLKGHAVQVVIPDDMPLLWVNAALFEQAIFNVLENAARHSPPKSQLEIRADFDVSEIFLDICDAGQGIPKALWQKIFDMFFTLSHGDKKTGGTGLGLAICQSVLTAHGGHASVLRSDPATGTCLRLSLPRKSISEGLAQ